MEMSTLLTTAATSVFASQKGFPVSFEISSANSASAVRTTLANRRTASIRYEWLCAAHAGQAARAAATSAAELPISPDHTSSPVAGLVEVRIDPAAGSAARAWSLTGWSILLHCFTHSPDRSNLVLERLPVVAV